MKTLYNIFTFNYSAQLSRKQFIIFSILPFIMILMSISGFLLTLILPSIVLILYAVSMVSLYRLNDAGINKYISVTIIMLFILLYSLFISTIVPTSAFTLEWRDMARDDLVKSAESKLFLIQMISYVYPILFFLFLFILPTSKKTNTNTLRIRCNNKFLKKLYYTYMTYYIYPLFKCLVFKHNFKISSKKFILFYLMLTISILTYLIFQFFYVILLVFLRDGIGSFTGGEFEDHNLGVGVAMVLSISYHTIILLTILIKIFSSSITYRLYDFNRIKKTYIHTIVMIYSIIALLITYYLFTLLLAEGSIIYLLYFLIIHIALILIVSVLPAKKY